MARVLVIDDDTVSREILRSMVEQIGHHVIEAADSKEGIARFRQEPVDLVITDIFLPPDSGLEVIKNLKALNPDARIIAVSGVDARTRYGFDTLGIAKRYGAFRVFLKPVDPVELQSAVEELLGSGPSGGARE